MDAGHRIAGIARSTETTSLELLDQIDGTIGTMEGLEAVMNGFGRMLASFTDEVKGKEALPGEYLDADDVAIDALAKAEEVLKNLLTKMVRGQSNIDKDCRLKDHHCEALHEAYERATGAVAELIELATCARAAIISHDLKAEPRDLATCEAVDALINSLRNS